MWFPCSFLNALEVKPMEMESAVTLMTFYRNEGIRKDDWVNSSTRLTSSSPVKHWVSQHYTDMEQIKKTEICVSVCVLSLWLVLLANASSDSANKSWMSESGMCPSCSAPLKEKQTNSVWQQEVLNSRRTKKTSRLFCCGFQYRPWITDIIFQWHT